MCAARGATRRRPSARWTCSTRADGTRCARRRQRVVADHRAGSAPDVPHRLARWRKRKVSARSRKQRAATQALWQTTNGGSSCTPLGETFGRPDADGLYASIHDGSALPQPSPVSAGRQRFKRSARKMLRQHSVSRPSCIGNVACAAKIFTKPLSHKFKDFIRESPSAAHCATHTI